jgi:hypothetical protein
MVEGYPVGYEWWDALTGQILKSCGDTSRRFTGRCELFSDGFELGNTSLWSLTHG